MKLKIYTLTVDTDSIVTTVHATAEEAYDTLRVNYAEDFEGNNDALVEELTERQGVVLYVDEHTLDIPLEIIHGRDPDASCELTIFAQGERTNDYSEVDLDPGKGWLRSDWELYKQGATTGGTPAFNAAVAAEFEAFDGSQYIEDDDD